VPATITAKEPGRAWSWRVGPVTLRHSVQPAGDGALAGIDVEAARPLEAVLRVSYGPAIALLLRNLARVASAG
jgi:hypothetical protein